MSCEPWQELLADSDPFELDSRKRRELAEHFRGCAACREKAVATDCAWAFALGWPVKVSAEEVDEVRRTVRAMRRVQAVERSWPRRFRKARGVAALAALLLVAILLAPERRRPDHTGRLPFAGALGVGSGLVSLEDSEVPGSTEAMPKVVRNLDRTSARVHQWSQGDSVMVVIEERDPERNGGAVSDSFARPIVRFTVQVVEASLSTSAGGEGGRPVLDPGSIQPLARREFSARSGEQVSQDLGGGFHLRFRFRGWGEGGRLDLRGFDLQRSEDRGLESLLRADLEPWLDRPLVLGLKSRAAGERALVMLMDCRADAAVVR